MDWPIKRPKREKEAAGVAQVWVLWVLGVLGVLGVLWAFVGGSGIWYLVICYCGQDTHAKSNWLIYLISLCSVIRGKCF